MIITILRFYRLYLQDIEKKMGQGLKRLLVMMYRKCFHLLQQTQQQVVYNEKMQFYLDRMPEEAPAPTDSGVEVKNIKGQVFAVSRFGGIANEDDGERQALALQRKLERDDLQFEKEWVLARYNDPGVLPPFRRNEILVPLKDFNLPSVL